MKRVWYAILGASGLAACSSSASAPSVAVLPVPTPVAVASSAPFAVQTLAPIPTGTSGAFVVTGGGYSAQFGFATVVANGSSGVTVVATLQNAVPAGFPALASRRRISAVVPTPLLFLQTIFSTTVSVTNGVLGIDVPGGVIVPGAAYYLAFFDPNLPALGWQRGFGGPATAGATRLSFILPASATFAGATTYAFAVYAIPAAESPPTSVPAIPTPVPTSSATPNAAATPTPSPSPSPTASPSSSPAPSGVVNASPASVTITTSGSAGAKTVTISETNYTGAFTESDSCASPVTIATVSGSGASWTLTGVANGTCLATFRDASNNSVSVTITVTGGGFAIQDHQRGNR